jgi:hypothetical protein
MSQRKAQLGGKAVGKMTPLGTESVYKGKYLLQGWTLVLKGTSGRTIIYLRDVQTSIS